MNRGIPDSLRGVRADSQDELREAAVELYEYNAVVPLEFPNAPPIEVVDMEADPDHPKYHERWYRVYVPLPHIHVSSVTVEEAADVLGVLTERHVEAEVHPRWE